MNINPSKSTIFNPYFGRIIYYTERYMKPKKGLNLVGFIFTALVSLLIVDPYCLYKFIIFVCLLLLCSSTLIAIRGIEK